MTTVPAVGLVILDGWGLAPDGPGNAVSLADTPVFDRLWEEHDHTTLTACGPSVGLPEGQMGNSEVGHLNLGAGAIVKQDLVRIDEAIEDGSLAENEVLLEALRGAPRVHFIGLVSEGGVHSADRHLKALIELAASEGVEDLVIHAFTDGRDTSPTSGAKCLADVERWSEAAGVGRIGSVIGRYFAMDRDTRWDRTQKAVDLLMEGKGEHEADSGQAAAEAAYARDETDEFITPTTVGRDARIRVGDSVIGFNFRPDRMRQITEALTKAGVDRYVTLTEYEEGWPYPVAFLPDRPEVTLAKVISERGETQLHVSETEKYPHVTYFFNGGEEAPYPGEVRELVDSPRDVPTYDHKPEMSARAATDAFVRHWVQDRPVFGIINFANADMVGHTGVIEAAVKGVETVDECLGRVIEAVHAGGGAVIVTADHGNADEMLEEDGSPDTAHSLNPVPFLVTLAGTRLDGEGILADVAPTALALLGIEQPPEMTGRSLLAGDGGMAARDPVAAAQGGGTKPQSKGLLQGLIAKRVAAATEHALEGPNQGLLRAQKHVWIALCDHYFRLETSGWERLPQETSLLIGNHSGGALTMDAWTLVFDWWRRFGTERVLHATAHDVLMAAPGLGDYFRLCGVIPASRHGVSAALSAGRDVIIWPGGEVDAMRNWRRRDQVVLGGRKGFIRQAIRSGVPIVPVASVGGHDTVFVLSEGRWLANGLDRVSGLKKKLRGVTMPIVLGMPLGLTVETIPTHLPLPAKIRTELLDPIHVDKDPERVNDREYVDSIYLEVESAIQDAMNRLARQRRFPIFR